MFSDRNLKEEVKALKSRLETLEHWEFGKKIEELQKANHEIEKIHQDTIEGLRKENHKLALRLSRLQGIAAFLLVMLSGIAIYYIDQYRREIDQNRENRPEVYEVLIDIFHNKLGDTIDRISLLAPNSEDMVMVKEVNDMQTQLSKICASSDKFAALSKLTKALNQIVIEHKAQDASNQLNNDMLPSSSDRFVASRALLLQAAAIFYPNGLCNKPDPALELINKVIEKDSGVVSAFNLRGVCLAQKSLDSLAKVPKDLEKKPALWEESVKQIHASLRDNEFAYQFKPSQWSRIRFLNNKVWNSMQFLSAAVPLSQNMNEALKQIGEYKDMEAFFVESLKEIQECYLLSHDQATYFETEAELHALEYTYYTNNNYNHDEKAKAAKKMMIEKLIVAIDKDLLRARKLSNWEETEIYFKQDILLKPLFDDPDASRKIKDRIEHR